MTDILFLIIALGIAALLMIPVIADGIHHTRFWTRRKLPAALTAAANMAAAFIALGVEIQNAHIHLDRFAKAVADAGRRRR